MKTEPTEAYRMIEEDWYAIPYMGTDYEQDPDIVIDKKDVYEIAKKAFQEGQSSPKIKQLEWERRHGTIHYINQYNPIGYTAVITEWAFGKEQCSVRLGLNDSNSSIRIFNSLDEAKDFVQKDFERRIKECLIIE